MPTRATVAVLRTSPQTVLQDYEWGRLFQRHLEAGVLGRRDA